MQLFQTTAARFSGKHEQFPRRPTNIVSGEHHHLRHVPSVVMHLFTQSRGTKPPLLDGFF